MQDNRKLKENGRSQLISQLSDIPYFDENTQDLDNYAMLRDLTRNREERIFVGRFMALLIQLGYVKYNKTELITNEGKKANDFFWFSVTEKGTEFGNNLKCDKNFPPCTMLWNKDKFNELYLIVEDAKKRKS